MSTVPRIDQGKRGWLQHVVHPLLLQAVDFRPSTARAPAGNAGGNSAIPRRAVKSRCFKGLEGQGCPLSLQELEYLE